MAEAHDRKTMLYENLLDAGVEKSKARGCVFLCESGKTGACLRLLKEHRTELMSSVRRQQKQIDCLDFLTYRLEKKESAGMQG